MMRLTTFFLIAIFVHFGTLAHAQNLTLNEKNIDVERLFMLIEAQTDYNFLYDKQDVEKAGLISINIKNATIETVLDLSFTNQPLAYKVFQKTIVVRLKESYISVKNRIIYGKVTDENNEALSGVTVNSKAIGRTTFTDGDGNYNISTSAAKGDLTFSYIGYSVEEVIFSEANEVNVIMKPETTYLNEVVTIGYGQVSRRDLTGSISSLKVEDLQKAPVRSFEEALAGRAAGVVASAEDGQPGARINIVIRGSNSLTQDNSPLYVIDGFPVENPNNNAISPADIDKIELLKDASSTAIYGARGANGVVVITTKHGREGSAVIAYQGQLGFVHNNRKIDLMDPFEYIKYQYERDSANVNATYFTEGRTLDYFKGRKGVDLQDSLFGINPFHNHHLTINGGSKDTRYHLSASTLNQDGIIVNSGFDRYQGRINLDQIVNKKLKVGVNANFSHLNQYGTSPSLGGNGFYYGNMMYSVWAFRPVSSKIIELDESISNNDEEFLALLGFNPIKTAENEHRRQVSGILSVNTYAEYLISSALRLRITGGLSRTNGRYEVFNNSQTPLGSPLTKAGSDYGVSGSVIHHNLSNWLNENTLTYNKNLNASHHLNVVVGFTTQGTNETSYGASANHIPNEYLGIAGIDEGQPLAITSTSSGDKLASFLGRINYTYLSKYLFTVSFRSDGSSKFAPQNRWSYFPSGAFAWKLSEESFVKRLGFISNAKMRLSYGATGNNRVDDFAYLSRISLSANGGYSYNNQPMKAALITELGNRDLKWETTKQVDLGFDLGIFDQRITLEMDLYRKVTKNLLLDAAVPSSIGFTTAIKNIGSVENRGLEINLNTVNIRSEDFNWNSNFNISFNKNKVLALAEHETTRLTSVIWNTATTAIPLYIAEVGSPIARFYGYKWEGNYQYADFLETSPGVYTLRPNIPAYAQNKPIQPGDIKYADINGDGIINSNDATVIGNPNPIFFGGFTNNFSYKNFDLNVFFQYSVGADLLNANRIIFEGGGQVNQNMFATYQDRWTPTNQSNTYFRTGGAGPATFTYSSRVVEDGSYLKLKTVSLGYNFSDKTLENLKLNGMRFFISCQNLYTLTKYEGFDPEVSKFGTSALTPGFDYSAYPHSKTIIFGLNIKL